MFRKRNLIYIAVLLVSLAALGGGSYFLLRHEPTFYRTAEIPAGAERTALSMDFLGRFTKLVGHLVEGPREEPWSVVFSQAQINSYLAEDFVRLGDAEALKRQGISDPRIMLLDDRIRLGFRYGTEELSTVVSLDMRVWLAPKDVNVFAVEILGRRAGGMPLSTQSVLSEITELARKHDIEVSWYRHEGHPVALLRLQSNRPRPSAQFNHLNVQDGMVTIGGVSLELPPPNAGIKEKLTKYRLGS